MSNLLVGIFLNYPAKYDYFQNYSEALIYFK